VESGSGWRSALGKRLARHHEALLVVLVWGAFGWFVLGQATVSPQLIWQDSNAYIAVAAHPLWSHAFWAGTYPPLVPLLWKVTGSTASFVLAQGVVAVAAWGFLALGASRLLATGWRRLAAFAVLLAFATVTPVVLWNRSVLSESVSLSLVAALFGCLILLARRPSWPRMAAVVATAVALVSVRDSLIWTVGALGVIAGVYAVVTARRDARAGILSAALAVSLVVTAALASWGVQYSKREVVSVDSVLEVRIFPYPPRVAWFARHGMPEAAAIDNLARHARPFHPGQAEVVSIPTTDPTFGPLVVWEQVAGPSTYARWIVSHPTYLISEPLVRPERSMNDANGTITLYAATNRVDSPLTPILWPTWWWLLPMAVAAVATAAVSGAWRCRAWGMVAALSMVGIIEMVVSWNADGQEAARHTIEGFLEVRLGVLILLLFGVFSSGGRLADALGSVRPGRRRRGSSPTGTAPTESGSTRGGTGHPRSGAGDGGSP
jgi:hypothetical protein